MQITAWKVQDKHNCNNYKWWLNLQGTAIIRQCDCACFRNEEDVGKAIKESGIQRDNIFVTTKVVIKIVCVSQYISYQYRFGTLSMATRRL
jgi:diketogulonate reductase-like aldo/keto reductase